MKIRIGTDLVHIPRIESALARFGPRFLQRVYTLGEQQDCGLDGNPKSNSDWGDRQKIAVRLAGRWAAKEAVVKALGTGWQGVRYTDVEIRRQPSGEPQVYLHGAAAGRVTSWGTCQWQLSLSHDGEYAIATALLVCVPSSSKLY